MLGASFDSPADNKAFAQAQLFTFPLLSDVDRSVGAAYKVVRPPDSTYADYPERISYLIDPTGTITKGYLVTDVAGHAGDVLADLAELQV